MINLLVVFLAVFLVSCTADSKLAVLKTALFGTKGDLVSLEQAKLHGDAFIQATLGKNKAVLEKKGQAGQVIYWQGIGGVAIVTKYGRVVQLIGIDVELRRSSFVNSDPLSRNSISTGASLTRILDYMPNYLYDIKAKSKFTVVGRQNITVLGFRKSLLKVQEIVAFDNFKVKRTNTYWLDPATMLVWKSRQYYAPHAKPIILERVHLSSAGAIN